MTSWEACGGSRAYSATTRVRRISAELKEMYKKRRTGNIDESVLDLRLDFLANRFENSIDSFVDDET